MPSSPRLPAPFPAAGRDGASGALCARLPLCDARAGQDRAEPLFSSHKTPFSPYLFGFCSPPVTIIGSHAVLSQLHSPPLCLQPNGARKETPGAAQSAATHPQLSARRLFALGTDPLRSLVTLQPSGLQRRWEQSSAVGVRGRRGSARLGAAAAPLPLTTPRALPARGWDYSAPPPGSPQPLTLRTPGPALTTCRAAAGRGPGTRPPPPPP